VLGRQPHQVDDRSIQLALVRQAFVQFAEFPTRGQLAKPEQIAGFFKGGVVGQFVDINAAVRQDASFTVDEADARGGCNHSFQAFGGVSCGGHARASKE